MLIRDKTIRSRSLAAVSVVCFLLLLNLSRCQSDYPATKVTPKPTGTTTTKPDNTSACSCTGTSPISTSSTPVSSVTPVSSTTAATGGQVPAVDTLGIPPPRISPNGGRFHVSTPVKLTADTLPPQALVEYSVNGGQTWQTGDQFTLTNGGTVLTRLRLGDRISRSRAASFSLYFERMLVIGNSIMSHAPDPSIGWLNFNGMAASAPEKDFVHLLTSRLQTLHPPVAVKLQSGGNFERQFGTAGYSVDEFNEPLQQFRPDLIVVRIGENVDENQVVLRDFETQFRRLLDRLAANSQQPVKIVCTTSVWHRPQADAVIRKVTLEKGHSLVDLSCMVWQSQYFAGQYTNAGVAAHPNDAGMQRITDLLWQKIQ